jgi:hypothetical protein
MSGREQVAEKMKRAWRKNFGCRSKRRSSKVCARNPGLLGIAAFLQAGEKC